MTPDGSAPHRGPGGHLHTHRFCGQHFAHKKEAETCTAPLSWEAGCSRNAAAPEAWGPSSDGHCHLTWYLRRLKAQNAFPGRISGHPACPLPPPGAPSAPAPRASADSAAVLGWSPPQRQRPEISTEEHNQREAFPFWGHSYRHSPVGMTAWEAPGKGRSKASTVTRLCALHATGPPAHGTPALAALRHFRPQTPFQINRLETPTQEHWGALAESGSVPRGGEPATSTQDPWPDACDMSAPVFISQPGILSFKNLSIRTLFNKSKPSLQALQWAEGAAQSSGCSGMSQILFS